jgi:hypothetical protein
MARASTPQGAGEAPGEEIVILPEAEGPSGGHDDADFVRSGRWYSWGQVHGSLAVWKGRRSHKPIETFDPDARAVAERRFKDLEAAARLRSARRRARVVRWSRRVAIGAIIAGLGVGVGALIVALEGSSDGLDVTKLDRTGAAASRYDDPLGGYSLQVPQGWNIVTSEVGTRLIGPDGAVSISIEPLPGGNLREAAEDFLAAATDAWHDVTLETPVQREIGGAPAIARGGTAVDASGGDIRFLAIVVAGSSDQHHGMLVLVPPSWDAATGFTPIAEIIGSLKPA